MDGFYYRSDETEMNSRPVHLAGKVVDVKLA